MFFRKEPRMPTPEEALVGRDTEMPLHNQHFVLNRPMRLDITPPLERAMFGLGCFWGAEKRFWSIEGVYTTAVGYSAGFTKNPTYKEVCSGHTGHNEVVWLVFDPTVVSYTQLLAVFFENHNPTQGMRQGNDVGTQYRSGIYVYGEQQRQQAVEAVAQYQQALSAAGYGTITTEVLEAGPMYYAEDYHQQYLSKNPNGYCGLGGTGVSCPIGLSV